MKGDVSRHTFHAARHYTGVRMQMGRVQLDADWNEQVDIARYRVETETLDAVGRCGGPLHDAAFRMVPLSTAPPAVLAELQQAYPGLDPTVPELVLLPGRYYVDGILCACDHPVLLGRQPDLPRSPGQAAGHGLPDGAHLLYLDVWERHLTALEAPAIREVALGGPDTATRTRTVWQVRSLPVAGGEIEECAEPPGYADRVRPTTGRLRARARPEGPDAGPCVLPDGAGYQGMENQLYRAEVHFGGQPLDPSAAGSQGSAVTGLDAATRTVTVVGGTWSVGGWVELFATGAGADPMEGMAAQVAGIAGAGPFTLTLSGAFPAMDVAVEQPRLRAVVALWKWSRDNGIVVARVVGLGGDQVTLESPGPDDVLDFDPGHWVELYDDLAELDGRPGQLLQVGDRDPAGRVLTLRTPAAPLDPPQWLAPGRTPLLRRWDGIAALKLGLGPPGLGGYAALEDGVEVRFEAGTYRTGEYWMIPARTATAGGEGGGVEWPAESPLVPAALRPPGIEHHYCRLAGVRIVAGQVQQVVDCRCLFAPATELAALAYVSGAGQEALPDPVDPTVRPLLGLPLVAGVGNGHCHPGQRVRFRTVGGGGFLDAQPGGPFTGGVVDVDVGLDGQARCWWRMGGVEQHQLVSARLLEPVAGGGWLPVHNTLLFNASLSVASQVAYHPRDCGTLQGRKTVQAALDRVVDLVRLYPVEGHGQEVMPGAALPQPLRVLVASTCGVAANRPDAVRFTVLSGGGTLAGGTAAVDGSHVVGTDAQGIASIQWTSGVQPRYQEVRATLLQPSDRIAEPSGTVFGVTLSIAEEVAYTPPAVCTNLAGTTTVKGALDSLCAQVGRGCSGLTVSPTDDWVARITAHLALGNGGDVCFRAGLYETETPLVVQGKGTVVFSGAGPLSRILCPGHERAIEFQDVDTVIVRDLAVETGTLANRPPQAGRNGTLTFRDCRSLTVEGCTLACGPGFARTSSCLLATHAPRDGRPPEAEVVVRGCTVLAGDRQVGILLVNPGRAVVVDNVVRTWGAPGAVSLTDWLKRDGYRQNLRRILGVLLRERDGLPSLGWRRIHQRLAAATPPADLMDALASLPDPVANAAQVPQALGTWMTRLEAVAAQGIVVGGTVAGDVLVQGNTVEDAVQGVHVGLSHDGPQQRPDVADAVVVSGNTITVRARHGLPATPHGIFVGNASQVMVDENRIASAATSESQMGIRLHGWYGPMVTVRENRIESFPTGIYFNARNATPAAPLYWAGYNVAVDAAIVVFVNSLSTHPLDQLTNRLVS